MQPLVTIIVPVYNADKTVVKALDSIPKRTDIELIIVDDCSTDNTLSEVNTWVIDTAWRFCNITLTHSPINQGCGATKNIGYDQATGKYIWSLDADDWFITDEANKVLDNLSAGLYDEFDIIQINNEIPSGEIWTGERPAAWAYIVSKQFLGNDRCPNQRRAADWQLMNNLKKRNPKVIYTDICCYHYNYLSEGSITWKYTNGLTDTYGQPIINS